jgi:hypothetical protein
MRGHKAEGSPMKKAFVLALVSSMLALGCELIVDFDRTKIVGEDVPETGTPETSTPTDATTDTGTDSSQQDTGTDAPADTGADAADAAADG